MGLKCGSSKFWSMVRNPVYCGQIYIPEFKEEAAYYVKAQHEPIVSEYLFYEVRDVLDGKKRRVKSKSNYDIDENFPLRGFLQCPNCGGMLTGSTSKGKTQFYNYYHCQPGCKFRHRADHANELFEKELRKFIPHPAIKEVYKIIVGKLFSDYTKPEHDERKAITEEMNRLGEKLSKARNLLLADVIDKEDYKLIKIETEEKIKRLESKLAVTNNKKHSQAQIE